jgi:hypothetical protein
MRENFAAKGHRHDELSERHDQDGPGSHRRGRARVSSREAMGKNIVISPNLSARASNSSPIRRRMARPRSKPKSISVSILMQNAAVAAQKRTPSRWDRVQVHTTSSKAVLASGETLVLHLPTSKKPVTVLITTEALNPSGRKRSALNRPPPGSHPAQESTCLTKPPVSGRYAFTKSPLASLRANHLSKCSKPQASLSQKVQTRCSRMENSPCGTPRPISNSSRHGSMH